MRVILVSPYSERLVGGIINWTKYIINYHHLHPGNVELVLLNNTNAVQETGSTGTLQRLIKGMGNYIPLVRSFRKKVGESKFDVVHICTSASFGLLRDLLLVNMAKKKQIKIVVHMHFGRIPNIIQSKGWEKILFMRLLKKVDHILVMDRPSLCALNNIGIDKVSFLPNPLSPNVQQLIEKQGIIEREKRKIVFAGHVVQQKGVFELVAACSKIEGVKLDILGLITTVETKEQLLKIAGDDGTKGWINIPGNMAFEDVIKDMMTCAIFVLPSYSEGFPNVILESMACGCPIIASSVGAIPEMLDIGESKPCGMCVPAKDTESLRKSIVYLLDNPTIANEMGINAQHRVKEKYEISIIWDQMVKIWDGILKTK